MAEETITPQMIIEQMPEYFLPEKAGSTNAGIQFDITGADAGRHWVRIADGKAESGQGETENPNLTLTSESSDFVKIFTGKMDPTAAFMQGKLKIKGDMGLAIKFQSMFRRPDAV